MISSTNPLVSVIVPVYNTEDYLSSCLDSIINQSYQNIEIICINDGTKDSSEKIIDQFIKKDRRLIKINQKNAGLNMARANGFNQSRGDYIIFVDSDDAIHSKTIEVSLQNILESDSEIAVFGYKEFKKNFKEINPTITEKYKPLISKQEIFRYLLINDPEYIDCTLQLTVWGKLYKRSVIQSINWEKSNYRQHEDLFWTPLVFSHVRKSICLNRSNFYFYRRDPGRDVLSQSTTGNKFNGKHVGYLEIVHDFSRLIEGILRDLGLRSSLKREFQDAIFGMYSGNLNDLIRKNEIDSENNTMFIAEFIKYSEIHTRSLIKTIDNQDHHIKTQDHHIKTQDHHIKTIESKLQELDSKFDPKVASITFLITVMLKTFKYRVLRLQRGIVRSK